MTRILKTLHRVTTIVVVVLFFVSAIVDITEVPTVKEAFSKMG